MGEWHRCFAGKVALITGGSQGIGKAIAKEIGTYGAKVVICSRSSKSVDAASRHLKDLGVEAMGMSCDVSSKQEIDALVDKTIAQYGRIDFLVNNAGLYPVTNFLEMTEEQWDQVIDTNLKGTFMCSQRVAQTMVAAGRGGAIVNIGSTSSWIARPGVAHYSSSKAAVNLLTKVMAVELAPYGIRVNALCPGVIGTETTLDTAANTPEAGREFATKVKRIPLGRVGTPEEIAKAAVFLLSPDASYFTASVIYEDGGYTAGISSY